MAERPVKNFRTNGVCLAVWKNKSGKFTTTITRQYQDKDGKYHETNQFSAGDLYIIVQLAKVAGNYMLARSEKDQDQC